MTTTSEVNTTKNSSWRALQIFSLYRFILAVSMVLVTQFQSSITFLGSSSPELFAVISYLLLGASILYFFATLQKAHFELQLQIQVVTDIFLFGFLMHASGGVASGLGMLMAISTTAACILIGRPSALGYSVLAATLIFAEEAYARIYNIRSESGITQVGILTVTFFGTGLLAFYLARRIRESELKTEQSIRGLASMEKLNEEIIQYMSTGVIVIDGFQNIRLINRAAWVHLGMPESTQSKTLHQVATPLARQLNLWRRKNFYRSKPFRNTATGPSLLPQFSAIGETKENAIIFLDDTSTLTQQAQNLKLASLGRLTASIAHEIRNPLGALSHAAQLIKESNDLDSANLDLIDIVENNARRVNEIIENIMQLSVKKSTQEKEIHLSNYLKNLKKEYLMNKPENYDIKLHFQSNDMIIHFDVSQLRQILNNLIDNGIRYSELNSGLPIVSIMVGIEPRNRMPFMDVIDKGEGIAPDDAEKIFEPFYTTSKTGTGLGLYLSRELCEANRARLDYIPLTAGGSCFRISFSINKHQPHTTE
jgi:two-component system sensor histidine kinase PilS (NtrC family)